METASKKRHLERDCAEIVASCLSENVNLVRLLTGDGGGESLSEIEKFKRLWSLKHVRDFGHDRILAVLKSSKNSCDARSRGNEHYAKKQRYLAVRAYSFAVGFAPLPRQFQSGTELLTDQLDNEVFCELELAFGNLPEDANSEVFSTDVALAFANRSAVLLSLGENQLCVRDILRAMFFGYPAHLEYKLWDRLGICYTAMHEYKMSELFFQQGKLICTEQLQAINMAPKQRDLLKSRITEFESNMVQAKRECKKNNKPKSTLYDDFFGVPWSRMPNLPDKLAFGSACTLALKLVKSGGGGSSKRREFVAERDIEPGEVVFVEKPAGFCLFSTHVHDHCGHCLRFAIATVPCRACYVIMYCSERCQIEAWNEYHKYECLVHNSIHAHENHEESVDLGALRTAVSVVISSAVAFINAFHSFERGTSEFASKKHFLQQFVDDKKHEAFLIGSNARYFTPELFPPERQIKYSVFGVLALKSLLTGTLLHQLAKTPFIEALELALRVSNGSKVNLPSSTVYIAGLYINTEDFNARVQQVSLCIGSAIMHQTNIVFHSFRDLTEFQVDYDPEVNVSTGLAPSGHYSSQLGVTFPGRTTDTKLGMGLFPVAKHLAISCCANAMLATYGKTLVVTAVKTIRRGETLSVAASPYHTYEHFSLDIRTTTLTEDLYINCTCAACVGRWPNQNESIELTDRGMFGPTFACPRCDATLGDTDYCSACELAVDTSAVKAATRTFFGKARLFGEKVIHATVTASDASEMFKHTCALRKLVEKCYREPSPDHYIVWTMMMICTQMMGNYFNAIKHDDAH